MPRYTNPSRSVVELGYAEITSNSTTFTTEADVSGLSVTFDGDGASPVLVVFRASLWQQTNAGLVTPFMYEGSTKIAQGNHNIVSGGMAMVTLQRRLVPTAGEHTYKVRLATTAGTVTVLAGSEYPAYIQVARL